MINGYLYLCQTLASHKAIDNLTYCIKRCMRHLRHSPSAGPTLRLKYTNTWISVQQQLPRNTYQHSHAILLIRAIGNTV
jgi:hypothetical protein